MSGTSNIIKEKKHEFSTIDNESIRDYSKSLKDHSNNTSCLLLRNILDDHVDMMESTDNIQSFTEIITSLLPNAKHKMRHLDKWTSRLGDFNVESFLAQDKATRCDKGDPCPTSKVSGEELKKLYHAKLEPNKASAVNKRKAFPLQRTAPEYHTVTNQAFIPRQPTYQIPSTSNMAPMKYLQTNPKLPPMKSFPQPQSSTQSLPLNENKNYFNRSRLNDNDNLNQRNVQDNPTGKNVFRTAREELVLNKGKQKKCLGTTNLRAVQSKFVSPLIGENSNTAKEQKVEEAEVDERLKHIDPKMVELVQSEIIDKSAPISWDDIAGLELAKSVIQEAVVWPLMRPDIFTGLRRPPKGILLFGPPGTGKTLIVTGIPDGYDSRIVQMPTWAYRNRLLEGKCIASQCSATFFSISASSLTSKWIGDAEKMVRALFAVAKCHQPAVVFIDEIDSLLTQRNDTEHEATRRIKTEFLVQLDGAATDDDERLLIIGATNRPQELDEAARRRLVKRLYIPLPEKAARKQIIVNLLRSERHSLNEGDMEALAELAEGFSGADMRSLCSEAAMGPIRAVPLSQMANIRREMVRPVELEDFKRALSRVRPSVSPDDLGHYVKWNQTYGIGLK